MLASLTWELVAQPSRAWPRYAEASARVPATTLVSRAATLAALASIAACVGAAAHPSASVSFVVVSGLAAVAGYVGTAAIAADLLPQLLARSVATASEASSSSPSTLVPSDELTRFASAAVLPMLASGVANAIPLAGLQVTAALLGAVATYYSGSLGARALLGMEGASRKRVATLTALVSTPPALLAALLIASR